MAYIQIGSNSLIFSPRYGVSYEVDHIKIVDVAAKRAETSSPLSEAFHNINFCQYTIIRSAAPSKH